MFNSMIYGDATIEMVTDRRQAENLESKGLCEIVEQSAHGLPGLVWARYRIMSLTPSARGQRGYNYDLKDRGAGGFVPEGNARNFVRHDVAA